MDIVVGTSAAAAPVGAEVSNDSLMNVQQDGHAVGLDVPDDQLCSGHRLDSPTVAVWRDQWLPASETFIYNQVRATRRWRPLPVGLRRTNDGLSITPRRAPFRRDLVGRGIFRVVSGVGLPLVYARLLRQEHVRVIHAHFGPDGITALPIARRLEIPLMVTFHGFDVTSAPTRPSGGGQAYLQSLREVFAHASALLAVSQFIADRLLELGAPPDKVVVAPIGIPVVGRPADAAEPERTGITFVGRLVEKKGVADLLSAVSLLPADAMNGEPIRIIGYGPLEASLRQQAAHLPCDVEFLGRRDSDYIASTLRRTRLFCAPSRTASNGDAEGFGMVFLEAALQGVPVVAYRHGGVPEAVLDGVTGLLADEGDISALSHHINSLLTDPLRAAAFGSAGRERVKTDFDIDRRTLRLEQIYDLVSSQQSR